MCERQKRDQKHTPKRYLPLDKNTGVCTQNQPTEGAPQRLSKKTRRHFQTFLGESLCVFDTSVGAGCGVLVSAKGVLRCAHVVCALWAGALAGA
nr:MAG TPA: hypothetical protein [Caudoviricetes sp.]